jgi:hypothetical protein
MAGRFEVKQLVSTDFKIERQVYQLVLTTCKNLVMSGEGGSGGVLSLQPTSITLAGQTFIKMFFLYIFFYIMLKLQ